MQVKKKTGKKHFAVNLHVHGRICTRSSCATAVVLQMIIFSPMVTDLSQLITTIYKKEKAWSYQVDQLSLRLPRRHAEPFAQKNNTDPLQRKWWDLLDMMNTKQNRRRTWGGGCFSFYPPPAPQPAPEKSVNSDTCFGGKLKRSESVENCNVCATNKHRSVVFVTS